ncbi:MULTISPECIES: GNAT family N-acetyltransferase [Pantoea]|jgi:GNAT superfamily N-acetyltransferase|uniref:GNAT family N-acetyltransferase n=1 Tax=Pantoea vagans TaxID=470934 RepID=A0ABY3LIL1_9GAMM|nr:MULTISPECIES: GNAT family N-acetyltransferase [Pantoea]ADI78536.1 putative tautomerase [Pantoea vagans C9-1]MBK5013353.1 GNAT family N-acetyltransferase [Pantoea sp. S62]PXW15774.1 L-amino acid N-acyltransferase YncA [Pantoea sp. JKS000250]TXL79708.1 GNAT family N-acetyltransferase [Pantoea vagans]
MIVRQASPEEAHTLWNIRNQAIRHGCEQVYPPDVIAAWTPDRMPASFPAMIRVNPFFVIDGPAGVPVATGSLDLAAASVEAIFTLPDFTGQGMAGLIIDTIKAEARQRGYRQLTLASTPNAVSFYEQHGFRALGESLYPSKLAGCALRCIEMAIGL